MNIENVVNIIDRNDKIKNFECFLCKFKCSKRHYYQNHLLKEHNLDLKLNSFTNNLDNFIKKKNLDVKRRVTKILKKIKNPCIFFDIGSSDGIFTNEVLNKRKNSLFYLFEPFEMDYNKSIDKFKNNNNVMIHNFGFSSRVTRKQLFSVYGEKDFGIKTISKSIIKLGTSDVIEDTIVCVTLDKFCSYNKIDEIDFVKIDTDGSEYLVVEGFMETLKRLKKKPYLLLKLKWGSKHPEWNHYKKMFNNLLEIGYLGFNFDYIREDSYLLIEPSEVNM